MKNKNKFTINAILISIFMLSTCMIQAQDLSDPLFFYCTDEVLYERGYKAYQENNFRDAALYLYAYAQRHQEILDGTLTEDRAIFWLVLEYVTRNLHAVAHLKTDDPYGREYFPLNQSFYDEKPLLPENINLTEQKAQAVKKPEESKKVTKQPSKVQGSPIAMFLAEPERCIPPCTVKFINTSSNADRFVWTVDGKIVSREKELVYDLKKEGSYRVKLVAYNGDKYDSYEVIVRALGE